MGVINPEKRDLFALLVELPAWAGLREMGCGVEGVGAEGVWSNAASMEDWRGAEGEED